MASLLMSLAVETLDIICSNIESHKDLISLAASSRLCSSLVIPRHTEYRVLRIGARYAELWEHLARRADLARNIRVLYLIEDFDSFPAPVRHPTTFVDFEKAIVFPEGKEGEDARAQDIARAIRNMESLQKFVWIQPWASGQWPWDSENYSLVWDALSASRSLTELKVIDRARARPQSALCNSSMWRISGLHSLHLGGFFRCQLDDHTHLSMATLSPNLRSLTISVPIESPSFWECRFPQLQKLALSGYSRYSFHDEAILRFLEAHQTLEDLKWYPLYTDSRLFPGSLCNIKRLTTSNDFALSILQDSTVPRHHLERVFRISLDQTSLPILEKLKGSGLRELAISHYDNFESIYRLAELFPELTVLDITKFGPPDHVAQLSYTLDDYIDALSRFPLLESAPDLVLWEGISQMTEQKKLDALTMLLQRCPNLTRLGHWDSTSKRVVDIVLSRPKEGVSWEQRPQIPI